MRHNTSDSRPAGPRHQLTWWQAILGVLAAVACQLIVAEWVAGGAGGRDILQDPVFGVILLALNALTWCAAFLCVPGAVPALLAQLAPGGLLRHRTWQALSVGLGGMALIWVIEGLYFSTIEPPTGVSAVKQILESSAGQGATWQVMAFCAVVAVAVPVLEELVFRGLLLQGMATRIGFVWALVFSSLAFGLGHLEPSMPMNVVFTGLIGALLAWTYRLSGRLVVPVLLHALNNALALSAVLLAR